VQTHARYVFNDFNRVYQELGDVVHPLDLDGEGLFEREIGSNLFVNDFDG
jgi:hypothetical protein